MGDNDFESQEKLFFSKMCISLNLDEKTKEKSSQYYLSFRQNNGEQVIHYKIAIACCILIAAKSQIVKTVDGKSIRGVGISINQVIKAVKEQNEDTKFCIKDFLFQLKQIVNFVKLDLEVQQTLKDSIKRFVFIHLFHCKFTEILNSFLIPQSDERESSTIMDDEYLKKSKELGWLLFIVLQNLLFDVNSKDVGPNACLMLSVLYEMLSEFPPSCYMKAVLNDSLLDANGGIDQIKLIEALCQEMKIKHTDIFTDFYQKQFKEQILWLHRQENFVVLKDSLRNLGVFRQDYITYNYNKLDQFYQRKIGHDNVDERFFLSERSLQTVTKFTPFTPINRQHTHHSSEINGNSSIGMNNRRSSFMRNLNYETVANNDFSLNSSLFDLKNKKYAESPSFTAFDSGANGGNQMPLSNHIEMYNWLCECIKKVKPPNKEQDYCIPHLQKYIDIFEKEKELKSKMFNLVEDIIKKVETTPDKIQQIFFLYLRVLDEMIRIEERKLEEKNLTSLEYYEFVRNLDFHRSLTAICIETLFFINNKELDLQNLFTIAQIEPFDFWKMINSFVKFDKKMPPSLKEHFYTIEKMIIFGYAWKSGSTLDKLIKSFEEKFKNDDVQEKGAKPAKEGQNTAKCFIKTEIFLNRSEEVFVKKVIYYTASQIFEICEKLGLSESIAENVWETLKFILSNETRLLINRNINHLIICSVYVNCKSERIKLNFEDILNKYKNMPHIKDHIEFSRKIELNNGEFGDIIKFYNEVFIPPVRGYIKTLKTTPQPPHISPVMNFSKTPQPEHKRPMVPIFSIQSPLKETLNSPYGHCLPLSVSNKRFSSTLMTPLTKTLYAFGESLESPHKNYIDFKSKIIGNQRNLKKLDFENNDLTSRSKIVKKETNGSDNMNLRLKPNFFIKKKENMTEKNISNFDDEMIDEKTNMNIGGTINEKKLNKTPEFKKEENLL